MEPDFPTFSDGTPKANGCLSQFCRCCRFLFLFLLFMVCPTLHIIAPHFCFSFWLVYVLVSPSTSTASFCIPTACVPAPSVPLPPTVDILQLWSSPLFPLPLLLSYQHRRSKMKRRFGREQRNIVTDCNTFGIELRARTHARRLNSIMLHI